ncbi:tail fiber domain-containing protein [bacterium]|nr:tail fiber domain-containing protein [bacterium]
MATTKVTKGVLTDGVIDNSKIAANTITTNQLHSTFTLDGVAEGASELYFTTARANSAIDARVTKALVDALNVDADTLDGVDILNIARTDVAETFAANVSGPTQANTNNSTLLATTAFVNNSIVIDRTVPLNHSSNGRHVKITVTASGGKYYIDGTQQAHVSLQPGFIYRFDLSDSSNASHPFRFSTTENGTHSGGSAYTTGVTEVGTAGSAGSYTQIIVEMDTPALYYYCGNHNAMGASVSIGGHNSTDDLSEGSTNLYYTTARANTDVDARLGAVSNHVVPSANITYDLGTSAMRFRDLYLSGSTIDLAGTKIQTDSNNDIKVVDGSNNLKRLVVDEIELGAAGSDKLILKRGSSGALEKKNKKNSNGQITSTSVDLSSNDTDDLSEGSSRLYYTTARANTDVDARVTKAFVDALNVDADTLDGNDTAYFAPIASPTFTGTPAAPTAANTVNSTQLATTAFVTNKITNLIGGAPGTLDTLNELAAAINDDSNYNSTLTTALATKAPLASPTFTGDIIIDSSSAELNLKSGGGGESGAINWTFNTTNVDYASIKLPYDTRATKGLWIDSGYPITVDATTRIDFDISGSTKADLDTNGLTVVNDITGANVRGNVNVRAGNTHMNNSGSIWRENFGGVHLTSDALYPGSNTGGVVDGSTSLGAAAYRFNTLWSQGVNNSGTITTQDIVVSGNLTVTGTTSQSTTTQSTSSANNMTLLSTVTGSPVANASFEVERGSSTNAKILWNETADKFVIDNSLDTGKLTAGSNTATALAVKDNGTNGGYFNVRSNVGGVATDGNVGLHVGWNKSNGGREVNMIFDGGTTQADTEMVFTSTDGSTYTDIFQINGGGNVDIKSGGLRIGTTPVIDSSRNIFPVNIHFNGATNSSVIKAASANIEYLADGEHSFKTYNGSWIERMTIDDNGLDLIGTSSLKVEGTEVISQAGSIVATSSGTHYSSGQVGLMVKDTGSGRGTVRIRSDADNAAECFFDVNGAIRWDISARSSSDAYDLNFYSQGSTPSFTSVAGPALQLKQNGDVKVQTALYTGGTVRISSTGALTNVSGNISQFTNNSGYITSADGGNAATLNSLNHLNFLRSDASDQFNAAGTQYSIRYFVKDGERINDAGNQDNFPIEIFGNSGSDAGMTFHISGVYAGFFGLSQSVNDLTWGGWSVGTGTEHRIYHAGNVGSQTITIGTLGVTNNITANQGIQFRRDLQADTGLSWYNTSFTAWQTYMASASTSGCGPNANITAPAGQQGVTSWALRSFIENVSGYGWTWESGGAAATTPTVMMGLNSSTGNLSVSGTVTANSDKRIKKNIVTIESALDKVLKLRGVTYQRTDIEDDKVLMGVVAQEVEEIIPEVVSLGDPDDPDSIKSVSYGNMVGVLIEAIKEQQLQIDELKKQIESK